MVARKQNKQAHRSAVVTEFKSIVLSHFDRDREAWRKRELGYLQRGRKAREKQQKLPKTDPVTQTAAGKTTNVNAKSTKISARLYSLWVIRDFPDVTG